MPKIVDLAEAKIKAEKHAAAMDKLRALPKQPKTITELLKRVKIIEGYLGLRQLNA